MFERRFYREEVRPKDLTSFTVIVKETDLFILADTDLGSLAREAVLRHRHQLESYISRHPEFLKSLVPVRLAPGAPESVVRMARAAEAAGVGPMAAVAGTFAELIGEELLEYSSQVIVENGGDIYLKSSAERVASVYAGNSPLSDKVGIRIKPADTPLGICTSSAKVGPSLSLGVAHAACMIAKSAALADASATAIGNAVKAVGDVENALAVAQTIEGILGAVVISGDRLGAWGKVELVKL